MKGTADDGPWSEDDWPPEGEPWEDEREDNGDLEDWEGQGDEGNEESVELLPCPECGREIYEDAECCPYCGAYVIRSTSPWRGRSIWWVLLGALGVVATILVFSCRR